MFQLYRSSSSLLRLCSIDVLNNFPNSGTGLVLWLFCGVGFCRVLNFVSLQLIESSTSKLLF